MSPLLFLIITEPLSRLVNNNPNIKGVDMGGYQHKISQFADDATAILRRSDVTPFEATLKIWCRATAMRENRTKREAILLGALRRNPARPPSGLIKDDAYTPDGSTVKALGVPMGNNFDIDAWWLKKYRAVKTRVSHWHGVARLSLTGRNILLQSILYGCLRYWFFT